MKVKKQKVKNRRFKRELQKRKVNVEFSYRDGKTFIREIL